MPRQAAVSVQNKFIRGLITEATALSFPEDACTQTDNVVFDPTGRVSRRPGIDMEIGYTNHFNSGDILSTNAYNQFVWNAVAGDGNISFVVIQSGKNISFYDTSSSTILSNNKNSTVIDLNDFLATESTKDPAIFVSQFAAGNGDLFITNPACDPFYVSYDPTSNTFSGTIITLSQRDFEGLDDGLAIDFRPTDTVSGTTNPNHLYNLINQGWGLTDALTQWDTARTDLPSNADYAELYRASVTDAFDNNNVTANDPGNRPAPQGHFILEVARQNRQEVFVAEGYSAVTSSASFSLIVPGTGTPFTDVFANSQRCFDGAIGGTPAAGSATTSVVSSGYVGADFSTSTKTIGKAIVYPADANEWASTGANLQLFLYAKNGAAPASGTDGTLLSTSALFNTGSQGSVELISSNLSTSYRYVWVYMTASSGTNLRMSEISLFSVDRTFERPQCCEFYAGRVFFGGISSPTISNDIFFSQIIEGKDQYGKCYQTNDPTCPIPDLLPDDGGVIKIPDMGTLKRLYSYQSALLVFASNGIWLIQGSTGSNFKATDYVVKKISSIGMNSPLSLISIRGLPAWWGEDGIYTVSFDANYDSFTPASLTLTTIDRFYQSVPLANKKYVTGTYDEDNQIAYWLYNDDATLSSDFYQYKNFLIMDAKSKAFYTWNTEPVSTTRIRNILFVKPATRTSNSQIKFFIHRNWQSLGLDDANESFGDLHDTGFFDWNGDGHSISYDSSFVSGYKLDGKTQMFFQASYAFIFLETEENSSAFVQSIFDFTTDPSEGKWSRTQQVYNPALTGRSINFRRLKMRGKGRALQLRFTSEEGKPFTIIGWSLAESTNSSL